MIPGISGKDYMPDDAEREGSLSQLTVSVKGRHVLINILLTGRVCWSLA